LTNEIKIHGTQLCIPVAQAVLGAILCVSV